MEFFLLLIGLFVIISVMTGFDAGTHDNHTIEDNDLFDDNLYEGTFYRSQFLNDDDGMVDSNFHPDSDDGISDPFSSTLSDSFGDADDICPSFDDHSSSGDIIMDPEYSYLDCNIYHDDSLD